MGAKNGWEGRSFYSGRPSGLRPSLPFAWWWHYEMDVIDYVGV